MPLRVWQMPSLPGFGFSGPPPPGGLVHRQVAELWHTIMTGVLGYRRFAAHGSDLGAGVTSWLARAHPGEVAGIHLATPGPSRWRPWCSPRSGPADGPGRSAFGPPGRAESSSSRRTAV